MSAEFPKAVFALLSQICGHCAVTSGESAKQAMASGIRMTLRRKGECLIEFLASGVVVFDLNKFMVVGPLSFNGRPGGGGGRKEGKKTRRGGLFLPYPELISFWRRRRLKKFSPVCQRKNRHKRESPFPVPETQSVFHPHAQ